jgi:hypothetical protein
MEHRRRAWAGVAVVACVLGTASVARAGAYSDERLGFSIVVPNGWKQIPIASEEKYVVAKWLTEREYVDKTEGWGQKFELKVVLFDPKGKRVAEVQDLGGGTSTIEVTNPYRTYKDWIKSDAEGGRYISKEEEIVVHGVPTTHYEVAYEKLTVPRHGLAFVYHAQDVDYCVTTEVLEQHWKNLSPSLLRAMKSFKVFPRKGSVKPETTGDRPDIVLRGDASKLTPQERYSRRIQAFDRAVSIGTERLPKGWKVEKSKNFVAFSHADDKFTDLVLDQSEGVRAWLDANLAFVGDGLPGPQILRICKDYDEERSFRDLSSRSNAWVSEICLSKQDKEWGGLGNVAGEVFDGWLEDKAPHLGYSLPPWLGDGIREWVGSGTVKGGKLEFKSDADLTVALRTAKKQGTLIMPKEMLLTTFAELMGMNREGGGGPGGLPFDPFAQTSPRQQAAGFVRFLLAGPGRTQARTKDLLARYVENLSCVVKDEDGKTTIDTKAPETEEEEEEQFKNRKSFWQDNQKDLLKKVFDKTFADWTSSDWSAVEKAYRAFAG